MGGAGMKELLRHTDKYRVRILARPSQKNKELLAPLNGQIDIVWGDLMSYDDVLQGVNGSDVVLHVGGMVSPQADYRPKTTRKINIGAAENIVKAVLAQPKDKQPRVVYIGSVAQLGDHRAPLHWGRAGDPIQIAAYDHYGLTKAIAERIIAESGIKRWVSLRQSGILYPAILKNYDPIMFHVPIQGCLEWATVEDSGRVLCNVCDPELPDEFWNNFYNIGSGEQYRLTNYEFECKLLKAIHCPPPEKIFRARWFTTRNFHGHWYADSDLLEHYLHFRANIPVDDYFAQMSAQLPWYYSLARIVPAFIIKLAMMPMAYKQIHGTQWWIKHNDTQRIAAYYGSRELYEAIPEWSDFDTSRPSDTPTLMDHGYDEQKPRSEFDIEDMRRAAEFRGGKCLSESMTKGDWSTPLEWQCHEGHRFKASPALILLGGHWCPECLPMPWNYDEQARHNPFLAQLWYNVHGKDEHNFYDEHIFDGWE